MIFTPNDYKSAFLARYKEFSDLKNQEDKIIITIYLGGLVIECLFRYLILLKTKEFDSKHNLRILYEKSGFEEKLDFDEKITIQPYLAIIDKAWKNNHRYYSIDKFKKELTLKTDKNTKNFEKFLKREFQDFFNAVDIFYKLGTKKWN